MKKLEEMLNYFTKRWKGPTPFNGLMLSGEFRDWVDETFSKGETRTYVLEVTKDGLGVHTRVRSGDAKKD